MSFVCSNRRQRAVAGVTSLELAACFTLFMVLVLAVVDISRYFMFEYSLWNLAAAAARQGMGDSSLTSGLGGFPSIPATLQSELPMLDPASVTLVVTQPSQVLGGVNTLTVTASTQFTTITPGLSGLDGKMSVSVTFSY